MLDHNNNGKICTCDIGASLESFGMDLDPEELRILIKTLDPNDDGEVSAAEFAHVLQAIEFKP